MVLTALLLAITIPVNAAAPSHSVLSGRIDGLNVMILGPGILGGPRPTPEQLRRLVEGGVQMVVSLQGGDAEAKSWWGLPALLAPLVEKGESVEDRDHERQLVVCELKADYVNFPINSLDPVNPDQADLIRQAVQTIAQTRPRLIYVKCRHGRDRTGFILALYRIRYEGWTPDRAYQAWSAMGHGGFWAQLFTHSLDQFFWREAHRLQRLFEAEQTAAGTATNKCARILKI